MRRLLFPNHCKWPFHLQVLEKDGMNGPGQGMLDWDNPTPPLLSLPASPAPCTPPPATPPSPSLSARLGTLFTKRRSSLGGEAGAGVGAVCRPCSQFVEQVRSSVLYCRTISSPLHSADEPDDGGGGAGCRGAGQAAHRAQHVIILDAKQ